jgi:hypothetical protein
MRGVSDGKWSDAGHFVRRDAACVGYVGLWWQAAEIRNTGYGHDSLWHHSLGAVS